MAQSWVFAASRLGFRLRLAAPKNYRPSPSVLARAKGGDIVCCDDPSAAAENADLLYTDTWISMGKEEEERERLRDLSKYSIQEKILKMARRDALVMHCLPAYRDKEIASSVFKKHEKTIFDEAENRLHIQKAIMSRLSGLD